MRCLLFTLFVWIAVSSFVYAGGGPQNVLLVVNDRSQDSLDIGRYYQQARGLNGRQVCHIDVSTNYSISTATFSNDIRNPVLSYIQSSGLSNQIDYIVLSRDIPYKISSGSQNSNSVTSAMFYDYKNSPPWCSLPANTASDYYEYESAFDHDAPPSSNRYYITAILTAFDRDENRMIVDHSTAAEATSPSADMYLVHATDVFRSIRWLSFDHAVFASRLSGRPGQLVITNTAEVSDQTNVMGYMIGAQGVNDLLSNEYVPGALGDHLTSEGGFLLDAPIGQMSALRWIRGGTIGTYGTVIEPCAYTNKFPNPRLYAWYQHGFSMGESYMMSVHSPYQGVLVGDPLCAPYAVKPQVAAVGIASNQLLSGSLSITVTATAASARYPVQRMDIYIDGLWQTTLTNMSPQVGNAVQATVDGSSRSYTVLLGDSLRDVTEGLRDVWNAPPPNTGSTAESYGDDRIHFIQDTSGVSGTSITYTVTVTNGLEELTISAWTPGTNFAETTAYAYQQVELEGSPVSGDVVRAVMGTTDGRSVTNEITANTNSTVSTLFNDIISAVNNDANLTDSRGVRMDYKKVLAAGRFEAYVIGRTNTWEGANLTLDWSVDNEVGSTLTGSYSGGLSGNEPYLQARGAVYLAVGRTNLQSVYTMNTALLDDGPHHLKVVAFDGTAVENQGSLTIPFSVSNSALHCSITNLLNGSHVPVGAPVTAAVFAASGGSITSVTMLVDGRIVAATNASPFRLIVSTTNTGAGLISVQAETQDSLGNTARSDVITLRVYRDSDSDGMPDYWEYINFTGDVAGVSSADSDDDGVINADEYLADTDPSVSTSYFHISQFYGPAAGSNRFSITFFSSADRFYSIELKNGSPLTASPWLVTNSLIGTDSTVLWSDVATTNMAVTNRMRLYRVGAGLY